MKQTDVVIIGAGAAGMMCAIEAGKRGRRVTLLDHAASPGEKIRISGGGRCNFTNLHTTPQNFLSQNPHFCVSALSRYTPQDFIDLIEAHHIAWHEKTLGQLFCDDSASQIITMLREEFQRAGVILELNTSVDRVRRVDTHFELQAAQDAYQCESLVIATGGKSIPKMGATGFGYHIAAQFHVPVIEPRAALVPLVLGEKQKADMQALSGVSTPVRVHCGDGMFDEALLFTHRGLSGPAILQISSYWREGNVVHINLLPGHNGEEILLSAKTDHPKQRLSSILSDYLPKRLVHYLANQFQLNGTLADIANKRLSDLAAELHDWRITPIGSEGYRTAEVTLGGVDTRALSSKSMVCNDVPGLYFIGEVVDVTGHLGGYNFQWAWASGHAAGHYV